MAKLGGSPGERILCWNGRGNGKERDDLEPELEKEDKADNNAGKFPAGREEESLKTTTVQTSKVERSNEPFKKKTVNGSKL